MPREKGKTMVNINLNDVHTPLTRKVNALYNVFASSNNLDDIENITDTLNCCADYGATVARKVAERQEAYSYLEGKDLCSRVTEINSFIASLGFGLMASVGMLNTLCRMAGVPLIAENVEAGNLETFVAFAKEVVDSYFTTGPVGSVSES